MAERAVRSEVAGIVSRLVAQAGAALDEGDELIIVEAMKMELPVTAPASGTVIELLVQVGDAVEEGQIIAKLTR
jgi:biotin carboxyl carrier protein